ncbi:hypothetical protein FRB90_004461 [Tulasnella sp. 427]|nr:hypothetical protein FRB90_004461 [Tulasnella sp. 427]
MVAHGDDDTPTRDQEIEEAMAFVTSTGDIVGGSCRQLLKFWKEGFRSIPDRFEIPLEALTGAAADTRDLIKAVVLLRGIQESSILTPTSSTSSLHDAATRGRIYDSENPNGYNRQRSLSNRLALRQLLAAPVFESEEVLEDARDAIIDMLSLQRPFRALSHLAEVKEDVSSFLRTEILRLTPSSVAPCPTKSVLGWLDRWDAASKHKAPTPSIFKGCFGNALALGRCLAEEGNLESSRALLGALVKFHGQHSGCLPQVTAWRALAELKETQSLVAKDLGKKREAISAAQEATSIWEKLVALDPTAHEDHHGASLVNLGSRLHEVNDVNGAIESFEQAVAIARSRRELKTASEVFASLGTALQCLCLIIRRSEPQKALEYAAEAASLAEAASSREDRESIPIVMAAHSLVLQQHLLSRHFDRAEETVERQFECFSLSNDYPDSSFSAAVSILTDSGYTFLQHGDYAQTRRILSTITTCPLESKIPKENRGRLYYLRAVCSMEEGDADLAATEIKESIKFFQTTESSDEAQLACAYSEYSRILFALNSMVEAYLACKEAVRLQQSFLISSAEPSEQVNLATYQLQLAQHELDSSNFEESIRLIDGAFDICRQHPQIEATHECLASGYALRIKGCLGRGDHGEVVRTAESLHIILESLLQEENYTATTFHRLLESLELMLPSLEYLGRDDEVTAARNLLNRLQTLQRSGTSNT